MDDRRYAGMLGLLLGDAVGVPYEFHAADALPPTVQIDMIPPVDFARSHDSVPPGTWSDDGAHALALWDSLQQCGRLDLADFGTRLVNWWRRGEYAVDDVFDVGVQTKNSIDALARGDAPATCGGTGESTNGNGSLMRALPLALWFQGPDTELVELARRQSLVTHAHVRSQLCCALYVVWARNELLRRRGSWAESVRVVRASVARDAHALDELETNILPDKMPGGTGYVVDCLHSARWALTQGPEFQDVVKAAIGLGNDTDTTAAVAGGIAGLRVGITGLPRSWVNLLRGGDVMDRVLGPIPG